MAPSRTAVVEMGLAGSLRLSSPQGMYPYRFTNIHMFVQRVADNIVRHGYFLFVTGSVPSGMDPLEVDRKLMEKYGIGGSRWVRARMKKKGLAPVHYVRHQDFFVMLAPPQGKTSWRTLEQWRTEKLRRQRGSRIGDLRRTPLVRSGYSISVKHSSSTRRLHVAVRIHPKSYRALMLHYAQDCVALSRERLEEELSDFPFEPWSGVRQQRWAIFRAVTAERKKRGFASLAPEALKRTRTIYRLMSPEYCLPGAVAVNQD